MGICVTSIEQLRFSASLSSVGRTYFHMTQSSATIDLISRAQEVASRAPSGELQPSTAAEYAVAGARLQRAREAAGASWGGLEGLGLESGTYYAARAAYVRLAHTEVIIALTDIRAGIDGAVSRLAFWLPEAERYPPRPDSDPRRVGEGSGRAPRGQHSKRRAMSTMPAGWLEELWHIAVDRRFPYLDALAMLVCSGPRPSEICRGAVARAAGEGDLLVVIAGTKVSEQHGQPWRKLWMQADTDAAHHLLTLAKGFADGIARVNPRCSPGVLSDAIADLAGDRWGRRAFSRAGAWPPANSGVQEAGGSAQTAAGASRRARSSKQQPWARRDAGRDVRWG